MSFNVSFSRLLLGKALLGLCLLGTQLPAQAQSEFNLPSLGDTSAGIMSREQEYQLGRAWLGMLRGAVATQDDPLLKDFIERHVYRLAETSQLVDRRLAFVLVDSPQLNAFAAPGGIVGVNGGLFLHAHTEGEFASVMAHELAHLSQRHFSRNLEQQQRMRIPMMTAMLASIVIAAAGGGDAGFAALASTQAAAIQEQRRFSRQNEQEADRIGIQNLYQAGYDPRTMPDMFERLARISRFDRTPPEFLLTHPVTQSRIADSRNRAEQLAQNNARRDSLEYQMMRARVQLHHESSPGLAARRFQAQLDAQEGDHAPARYGLVLALLRSSQLTEAEQAIRPLLEQHADLLAGRLAEVELLQRQGKASAALELLDHLLAQQPDNYPLLQSKIDLLLHTQRYSEAERLSDRLTQQRSDDPDVWYIAAEIRGLADNITGLHMARAEYFMLAGNLDAAEEQLKLAQGRVSDNFVMRSRVEARQQQLARQREVLKSF